MLIQKKYICSKCGKHFVGTLQFDEYECSCSFTKTYLCHNCAQNEANKKCTKCGRKLKNGELPPGFMY